MKDEATQNDLIELIQQPTDKKMNNLIRHYSKAYGMLFIYRLKRHVQFNASMDGLTDDVIQKRKNIIKYCNKLIERDLKFFYKPDNIRWLIGICGALIGWLIGYFYPHC